ncbi:hypothetical protein GWN91_06650 [Candidatus Saccharibacteria bacterium]|nr:hypothetical protein [Candidatus Saccharibacteria bacterium]NIV72746.1 hypothetical protein [Calditrichia bacterium]NIW80286.1 hypothetical protein [Calditrichia bacterium]
MDDDVYGELVARIVTTQGLIFITATPENTSSEILQRFYEINEEEQEDEDEETTKFFLCVSQDEVEHLTDEDREKFRKKLLPHQVQARVHGLFVLGDGQVFECTRDQITCDPFPLYEMEYLRLIIGLDFGYNDPTAAVLLASDPNLNGRVYVVRSYQQPFQLPPYHAIRIRAWGEDIPCAWPRDGFRVGVGSPSLLKIKDQYREAGLRMLPNPAFSTYNSSTEGSNLEAGIQMLYEAIHSDCLKIFDINENQDLIKRLIMYHRKDGKIPRQNAHKIDALRAGFCERKKARAIYQLERLKFGGGGKSKKAKTSFSLN